MNVVEYCRRHTYVLVERFLCALQLKLRARSKVVGYAPYVGISISIQLGLTEFIPSQRGRSSIMIELGPDVGSEKKSLEI